MLCTYLSKKYLGRISHFLWNCKVLKKPTQQSWKKTEEILVSCFLRPQYTKSDFLKYIVFFLKLWFSVYKIWVVFLGGGSSCEIQKNHIISLLALKELLLHSRVYIWLQIHWSCWTVFWGKNWQPDCILHFYSIMGPRSIFFFHCFFSEYKQCIHSKASSYVL